MLGQLQNWEITTKISIFQDPVSAILIHMFIEWFIIFPNRIIFLHTRLKFHIFRHHIILLVNHNPIIFPLIFHGYSLSIKPPKCARLCELNFFSPVSQRIFPGRNYHHQPPTARFAVDTWNFLNFGDRRRATL